MHDLSLNGIVRRYRNTTKPYFVRDIVGSNQISLRSALESILFVLETTYDFEENCGGGHTFGGRAAYSQTWTSIIVRIRLIFDSAIPDTTRNNLMNTWQNAIESNWSFKWGCGHSGEATCRLIFKVQWTDNNPHHTVNVIVGPARSNSGKWDTMDTGDVVSHEFGHQLGLKDEYSAPTECPNRDPVNTGTIMDGNFLCFPSRLFSQFANNIGSQVMKIAEHTHDTSVCT